MGSKCWHSGEIHFLAISPWVISESKVLLLLIFLCGNVDWDGLEDWGVWGKESVLTAQGLPLLGDPGLKVNRYKDSNLPSLFVCVRMKYHQYNFHDTMPGT